tara:strand:+ start:605 stop:835 length:231 start_codon:yes stop_codon:yes gene_type:complete
MQLLLAFFILFQILFFCALFSGNYKNVKEYAYVNLIGSSVFGLFSVDLINEFQGLIAIILLLVPLMIFKIGVRIKK